MTRFLKVACLSFLAVFSRLAMRKITATTQHDGHLVVVTSEATLLEVL